MSKETWLVTGASGCIGAWTVLTLVQEGAEVVALDRDTANQRLRLIGGDGVKPAHAVDVDIRDLPAVERVLDEHAVTHMVHLAALQVPFCRADPPRGAEVNVAGTVNLFEAARRHGLSTSIAYASSAAVYDGAGVTFTPANIYGVYKIANEGSARIYWQESQVASVGLRPLIVYGGGRDQGTTSSPTLAMAAAARGEAFRRGPGFHRRRPPARKRGRGLQPGRPRRDRGRDRGLHPTGRPRGGRHLRRRRPALRLPAPQTLVRHGCHALGRGRGRHRRALPSGREGVPVTRPASS
jgi:nucleoside-diphosphate-sugar epimerase